MKKDIISKEILKHLAKDLSKHILKIEIENDMELIDKEFTRIEKRDADLIFKNGNTIIHIEIQNAHHTKMHLRMLRYLSDIVFEYENLEVKQYLLYIGKSKCYMKNSIKKKDLDYKYDIIDIRDISCEALLYSNDPSAIILSILCDFDGKDKQIIVNTILKRLKELSDEVEYKNYLKMVNILSTNRNLEEEVKKGVDMLSVDMEKTPFYQIAQERGMKDGMKKGMRKGMREGISQGVIKTAITMIREFNLSVEQVSLKLNVSINELKKHLQQD